MEIEHMRYYWSDETRAKCREPGVTNRESTTAWSNVTCQKCLALKQKQGSRTVLSRIAALNEKGAINDANR
jgi:hypothetical protein